MADQNLLAGKNNEQLEAGEDTAALSAGDNTKAIPADTDSTQNLSEGYEVVVGNEEAVEDEIEDAEHFGEELTALRNLIQRYADQMDQLRGQVKECRESLRNIMDNDAELQQLEEQAKTVTTDVRAKKQRLKESPEAVQWQMKIKETQEEQKEIQDTLNNYLLRYHTLTGSNVIEDDEGNEREIKINAKLSSKRPTA